MHQQLFNHVTPETAFVISQFPYAHGVYTRARYWVETKPAYGQRIMYQYENPAALGTWFKAKTEGYFDICILEVDNSDSPSRGLVVMHKLKLDKLSVEVLLQLGQYYEFTPFQKEQILRFLQLQNYHRAPAWRDTPSLDLKLHKIAEAKVAMFVRKVDENGIFIQSAEDAEKEARRNKRAQYPSTHAARTSTKQDDSIESMDPVARALWDQMGG
jgi:hypothetical protein